MVEWKTAAALTNLLILIRAYLLRICVQSFKDIAVIFHSHVLVSLAQSLYFFNLRLVFKVFEMYNHKDIWAETWGNLHFDIIFWVHLRSLYIGIKHGFSCINIRQVPREVLKTKAGGSGFQHLPRDLANVNALKNHVRSLLLHKSENNCYISRYFLHYFVLLFHWCLANAISTDNARFRAGHYTSRVGNNSVAPV